MTLDGAETIGVAIKRIKSEHGFERNIRKAAEQIHRAKLPGIIAMDVSVFLNPFNDRLVVDEAMLSRALAKQMKTLLDDYHRRILQWVDGRWVQGLILIDHHVWAHPIRRWGLYTHTVTYNMVKHIERRKRQTQRFFNLYKRALPGNRAKPPK